MSYMTSERNSVHEPSGPANWEVLNYLADDDAIHIGNELHKLVLLIELIQLNQFADLHIDEYARSLIFPGPSQWPFAIFPETRAVQEMYVQRSDECVFTYF